MGILNALNIAKEVKELADSLHTSGEERGELALKAQALALKSQELENSIVLAHLEVAKAEAQHASWFVAGARPFGLWMSYGGIGAGTILPFLANAFGPIIGGIFGFAWADIATMDENIILLLMGIGGFESGRRTFEKTKGVSRDRLFPKVVE